MRLEASSCKQQNTHVTAPILRVPEEGTLGAEKYLKAHFDKLPEGRWCKGYTFGWFSAT
jgi:hypothetical protein